MQHKENCIKKNQFYEEELLSKYSELNNIGKKEAIKRVSELTEIKKYTEPDTPPEPDQSPTPDVSKPDT